MREDLIEEIGRLYGYNHIVSHTPVLSDKRGEYKGNIGLRKAISKRLRSLGLNETKTYTLISPEMDETFTYDRHEPVKLLRPMSKDKSIIRQTLIPSLLNVAEYNFDHNTKDVCIYEIANTYHNETEEDTKIAMLISGDYLINTWKNETVKSDFYVLKGIITNLLDYLGYNGRYSFVPTNEIKDTHPGATAIINVDNRPIGYIGKVHPNITNKDIFISEISMNKLAEKKVRNYKYKEISKYPSIKKDVAFVMPLDMTSSTIEKEIKRSGGKLLKDIEVFDLYRGENVRENEKSIAYSLEFESEERTLSSDEINELFNKIIDEVTDKLGITIRN